MKDEAKMDGAPDIESVLERVKHLASETETKLDNAIEFIDASEARIAKMEAEHAADALGLQVVTVRMPKDLVKDLDRMAAEQGRADHVVMIRDLVQQAREQWLARRQ